MTQCTAVADGGGGWSEGEIHKETPLWAGPNINLGGKERAGAWYLADSAYFGGILHITRG